MPALQLPSLTFRSQESVNGRYGGVGLVIASTKPKLAEESGGKRAPVARVEESRFRGVTVMDAFEGYAFEKGLRVGDRLLSVGGTDVRGLGVEQVRDLLRGDPGTDVVVRYERDVFGREAPVAKEALLNRELVRVSDVRLATLLGDKEEGVGYINLSGFNAGAGRDFGAALLQLRMNAPNDLRALVLDLRGNPGGLLEAAVEVASYLLPPRSEIVSSRGRDGVELVYRSAIEPIRPAGMKLVVLVNQGSASAAEIVAGAVQDMDAGVIVGSSRTFGKGLVQKIIPLPYDSALKFTVAKYYTPSGRCIQAINYKGGRLLDPGVTNSNTPVDGQGEELSDGENPDSSAIPESERKTFFTSRGRIVRDGGGIEPDMLVPDMKAGPAESLFLAKGLYFDFISDYIRTHDALSSARSAVVKERMARLEDTRILGHSSMQNLVLEKFPTMKPATGLFEEFRKYIVARINNGALSADELFKKPLQSLERSLSSAGLRETLPSVDTLRARITASVLRDLEVHRSEITNDLELALYSRELPDRLLLQKNALQDAQVRAAVELSRDGAKYTALLQSPDPNAPAIGPEGDKVYRIASAQASTDD